MPLVRSDLPRATSPGRRRVIGDAVPDALLAIDVPRDDRYRIASEHAADGLRFDRTCRGIDRSDACRFLRITPDEGRSPARRRLLDRRLADALHERTGLRLSEVCVDRVEVDGSHRSYGNGEARHAAGTTT